MTTAHKKGLDAEAIARDYLKQQGMTVLATRCRTPHGEIDLLCANDTTLIAVEVKHRKNQTDALFSISPRQQKRIMESLLYWQSQNPTYHNHDLRCDAFISDCSNQVYHLPNAWEWPQQ